MKNLNVTDIEGFSSKTNKLKSTVRKRSMGRLSSYQDDDDDLKENRQDHLKLNNTSVKFF